MPDGHRYLLFHFMIQVFSYAQGNLNMIAPDVEVEGKGIILISSEEGETEANNEKFLKDLGLVDGSILTCDDFLQSYTLKVLNIS